MARDVQTGCGACHVLRAPGTADAEDGRDDSDVSPTSSALSTEGSLPLAWRYETPYTSAAHPGFCCIGGRFLSLPVASASASAPAPARRVGDDGEVDPASTAERVWPGAYLLASYLQQPAVASRLRGARVLELGSGLGVAGLAAWVVGCARVTLSDLPENVPRLTDVIAAHHATDAVRATPLDWLAPSLPQPLLSPPYGPFDVVLAADCVFWVPLFAPLLRTLQRLVDAAPTDATPEVLLTVTSRLDRAETFAAEACDAGWTLEEVPLASMEQPSSPGMTSSAAASFLHTKLLRLRRRSREP